MTLNLLQLFIFSGFLLPVHSQDKSAIADMTCSPVLTSDSLHSFLYQPAYS